MHALITTLVPVLKPSEIVKILEDVVSVPFYDVVGVDVYGRVVLFSDEPGFYSLITLDPASLEKKRVTARIAWDVAKPVYRARRLVYMVDVSSGREQCVLYVVDLEKNVEYKLTEMEPLRIVGAVDTGTRVYYAGASSKDVAVYAASESAVEKLHAVDRGFLYVTDATENLVVGAGVLAGNPFSREVFVYRVSTGEFKVFTPKPGSVNDHPVITSSGKVVFESDAFTEERKVLVELDPETGEYRPLVFPYRDYEEFKPVEHNLYEEYEGKWLIVGKKEGRSRVYVDGREVFAPKGLVEGAVLFGGKLYASYSSLVKPSTVVEVDLKTGATRTILEARLAQLFRVS